ncbi:hypothetical protein COY95_03065 [Candidatus Woesearchaeota archaeon CG_4_10_14_0_8_um_filter_47_5]|nr:MAG: hypothetical protein COY95_03065 [Candidatus Woesearchaeota archaeon CG_4_10_14_0_8_um_filter_47_5]
MEGGLESGQGQDMEGKGISALTGLVIRSTLFGEGTGSRIASQLVIVVVLWLVFWFGGGALFRKRSYIRYNAKRIIHPLVYVPGAVVHALLRAAVFFITRLFMSVRLVISLVFSRVVKKKYTRSKQIPETVVQG